MFQAPLDVKRVLDRIRERRYVLPAIQREFVWSREQICDLFDSLMREYPIGSFLFWDVSAETSVNFKFYEVMMRYHERDFRHNPVLPMAGPQELTAILDGQQRLSALAIGLLGTHAEKLPRKRWANPDAFPETALHLELGHSDVSEERGRLFKFEFLTPERAQVDNERDGSSVHWYRIGSILETENGPPLLEYLQQQGLEGDHLQAAFRRLDRLWTSIHSDKVVAYHEEEDQDIDRVLEIFIRVNSGGTKLTHSDLLLSIASAQWKERDAREEINDLVDDMNRAGQGFSISKDLVLKSSLVLTDVASIRFQVANFTQNNMLEIERRWDEIKAALRTASRLLAWFGFSDRSLTADSVLIPIADYLHMRGLTDAYLTSERFRDDRRAVRRWAICSLLKRGVWGAGLDSTLTDLRRVMRESGADGFPSAEIETVMAQRGVSLRFDEEEIEGLLDTTFGDRRVFALLSLLYPGVNVHHEFHIDHVFPRDKLKVRVLRKAGLSESEIEVAQGLTNAVPNLQLLEGPINEAKQARFPSDWALSAFGENTPELHQYLAVNDLDGLPSSPQVFADFVNGRREKMRRRLTELLRPGRPAERAPA